MEPISESTWQYTQASHIAYEYDDHFTDLPLFRYDTEVLDEVLHEPGKVIDLGCGTGRHVVHLARRAFKITGVDLSPFMLDVTRDKLRKGSLSADLVQGSMTELSGFSDGSFRYAICMFSTVGLICGRENRLEFVHEVRRILEPGGTFVVHVHNRIHKLWEREGFWWLLRTYLLAPFVELEVGDMVGEYHGIPDMYLHLFSPGELRKLLRSAGMRLERFIPLNRGRSGPLRPPVLPALRSNGIIAVATK